jgi:hypothetical protein
MYETQQFIASAWKNAVISNTLKDINGCEKSSFTEDVRFLPPVEMTETRKISLLETVEVLKLRIVGNHKLF